VSKAKQLARNGMSKTVYRYDGQMGVEDVEMTSSNGGATYTPSALD
jgi:hypothetical protein